MNGRQFGSANAGCQIDGKQYSAYETKAVQQSANVYLYAQGIDTSDMAKENVGKWAGKKAGFRAEHIKVGDWRATKTTGIEVQEKLQVAADTDKRINVAREEYRPVATRGSLLYFLIVDMAAINNMYMVSLQQFLELFDFSIDNSEKAPLASKRIVNIIEYLTFYVTCYMQRGLYEKHKLIWVLMLAMKIESVADRLSAAYIGCLLKGGGALDAKAEKAKPHEWLPEGAWVNCIAVSRTVQMLRDLPDSIGRENTKEAWKEWYDHDMPETVKVPEFEERLDKFEKLLVVRSMREDRTLLSVQDYTHVQRWAKSIAERPAVKRGRMVNRFWGEPQEQLIERHSASDLYFVTVQVSHDDNVQVSGLVFLSR